MKSLLLFYLIFLKPNDFFFGMANTNFMFIVACLFFASSNALPCSECATEPQLETCSGNQAGQSNILITNEISVILIITIYLFVIRLFEISNKSPTTMGLSAAK